LRKQSGLAGESWGFLKPDVGPDDKLPVACLASFMVACPPWNINFPRDVLGVSTTLGIVANTGSGTPMHIEDCALPSINLLVCGIKILLYGAGLLRFASDQDTEADDGDFYATSFLQKQLWKCPTAAQCKEYGIRIVVQRAGDILIIGPGVVHTVISLTPTVAEAANILLLPDHGNPWSRAFVQSLQMHPRLQSSEDLTLWLRTTVTVCQVLAEPLLHVGVVGDIHFIQLDKSKGGVFFLRTDIGGAFLFVVNTSPTLPGPYKYSQQDLPVVFLTLEHELLLAPFGEQNVLQHTPPEGVFSVGLQVNYKVKRHVYC
jgi:hypothetical protein